MTRQLMKPFSLPTLLPDDFFDQFENFFNGLDIYDPHTRTLSITKGFPKGDIFLDKDENRVIELSLAGYKKEQLSVVVGDDSLTVSASKCDDSEDERAYTRARRAFTQKFTNLNGKLYNLEQTKVSYKDGLLRIVVPKKEIEEVKPKELEIE